MYLKWKFFEGRYSDLVQPNTQIFVQTYYYRALVVLWYLDRKTLHIKTEIPKLAGCNLEFITAPRYYSMLKFLPSVYRSAVEVHHGYQSEDCIFWVSSLIFVHISKPKATKQNKNTPPNIILFCLKLANSTLTI